MRRAHVRYSPKESRPASDETGADGEFLPSLPGVTICSPGRAPRKAGDDTDLPRAHFRTGLAGLSSSEANGVTGRTATARKAQPGRAFLASFTLAVDSAETSTGALHFGLHAR
jgi:hypothetical protein